MGFLEALILGIIQGLTEFLPVSSSGHLELAKAIFGDNLSGKDSMFMTVVLHLATALSTIVIFRKDIAMILKSLFTFKKDENFYFALKIVLSMIPAAIVGVLFDDILETFFDGQILLIGFMLILTGLLLFLANKSRNTSKAVSFSDAIIVGIAQAIAILPGISRSGATISTSVLLGIDRERAARFSFLMVVPLILGKVAKDLISDDFTTSGIATSSIVVGFISAFVVGLIACIWMIKIVKRSKLSYFSYYCFIIGIVAISFSVLTK